MSKYFKLNGNTPYILSWKYKGLSSEIITPSPVSNNLFNPLLYYSGTKIRVKFNRKCLKQSKISYTHGKIVNIYTFYEITGASYGDDSPALINSLFGAVTLTKNYDIEKYKYSGYGIGFDRRSGFSFPGDAYGQNALILGVDMSSPTHIDNKKKKY